MDCDGLADNAFGPLVSSACRFDFTLLFEESVMRTGPATIFVLLAIPRFYALLNRTRCLAKDAFLYTKLVITESLIHFYPEARDDRQS